ncbi:SDR family oxidoreductase [Aeribacillus composti]|uniref:SDR family oxidoreductase n=1 Tax=Aeribacillus composti TaxID=1868734 RepID=UPI002E1D5BF6|nr:SDR family oxidoreductase [Aeribacillus composti]
MEIVVVGANGKIGKILVQLLKESNEHTVKAMIRNENQKEYFDSIGVKTVLADLEGTVDQIVEAIKGAEGIVFTAGSGGHTGADKTLLVDLDGAVKTIEAAEKTGVKRFIMVSALQAHNRQNWNEKIKHYYVAKHYADRFLVQSRLNYTIVRPGALLDEKGTGEIKIAENLERAAIPREDVASVIFASITEKNTFRRSFDLVSGNTPIREALKNF